MCMQWPFRMGGFNGSQIPFVEQDGDEEVAQCVALVFTASPGDVVDDPKFGLTDPTFRPGGVSVAALEAAANTFEPRALLRFAREELVGIAQTVDVEVSDAGTD